MAVLLGASATFGADLAIDDIMFNDPVIRAPRFVPTFSQRLKPLWLQALQRPEAEIRRMAADTITIAAERGMKGLEDAGEPLAILLPTESDPVVRRAIARTLVALRHEAAAEILAEIARKDGLLMSEIVEPALGRWNCPQLRQVWLERLESPSIQHGLVMLAIDGLGAIRESEASKRLMELLHDEQRSPEVRLKAARALSQIHESGLLAEATQLCDRATEPNYLGRLLAANLLGRHSDAETVELLKRLATDEEPSVVVVALSRLFEIDLNLALPFAKGATLSADANVRRRGAEIFVAKADVLAIEGLGPLLADRNPTVRRYVASSLADFGGRDELKSAVLEQSVAVLAKDEWRGLEQAALVLGYLDHEPAAPRLMELLSHPRAEVGISVAWALRKLRVPETYPPLLQFATTLHRNIRENKGAAPHAGRQISQIFQLFGEVRFRESEPLMKAFVPKSMLDPHSRAAACWAIGYFHENVPDEDLAQLFAGRVSDVGSVPPEFPEVRHLSAVAIGRMKAESQLPVLRKFSAQDGLGTTPGIASYWGIEQITGEKTETIATLPLNISGWFLEPTGD